MIIQFYYEIYLGKFRYTDCISQSKIWGRGFESYAWHGILYGFLIIHHIATIYGRDQ
jgi:hypothetical protein